LAVVLALDVDVATAVDQVGQSVDGALHRRDEQRGGSVTIPFLQVGAEFLV